MAQQGNSPRALQRGHASIRVQSMKLTVRTLALLCALLPPHAYAAPAMTANPPANPPMPHASAAGEGAVGDMILQAVSLMGIAYRFGGNTPVNGFDCSGFIRYVFQSSGVNLPRSAAEQASGPPGQPRRAPSPATCCSSTPVASITRTTGCIWAMAALSTPAHRQEHRNHQPERQLLEQPASMAPGAWSRARAGGGA